MSSQSSADSSALLPAQTGTAFSNILRSVQLRSIGSRIAVSVIVLMTAAVAVVGWFGYSQQQELGALSIKAQLKEANVRVVEQLKARERIGLTLAHAVASYPGIAEHIDSNDRV